MNWITIRKDLTALQQDYNRYYNFSYKMLLKHNKQPIIGIILALLIFSIALANYLSEKKLFDLIVCFLSAIGIVYFPLTYLIRKSWFMKQVQKNNTYFPDAYDFSFDENGIYYNAPEFKSEIKWDYFSSYELNPSNKTIYVYGKTNRLEVLFVERNLGESNFRNFLEIITQKLPYKKY